MGEAIAFDAHRFVKRLTEHGLTEEQAEALANGQVNQLNSNLATKAGIEAVQRDTEALRQKTKADSRPWSKRPGPTSRPYSGTSRRCNQRPGPASQPSRPTC